MFSRPEIPRSPVRSNASTSEDAFLRSGGRPRRALIGSLLALSLASSLVWAAPASAVPSDIGSDFECRKLRNDGTYWSLDDFFSEPSGDDYSSTYDVVDGAVIFLSTVSVDALGDFGPRIQFWNDLLCAGIEENDFDADAYPPESYLLCVAVTPGSFVDFDLRLRDLLDPGFDQTILQTESKILIDFMDAAIDGIPRRIEVENFVFDPTFTGSTIQVQIVLASADAFETNESLCGLGGGSEEGRTPVLDIDPETFLNRATAETGALPDTI